MFERSLRSLGLGLAATMVLPALTFATIVPFEESFSADSAGWGKGSSGVVALDWTATGGSDGGGFAGSSFNFQNSAVNTTPPILHAVPSASGGAFAGNWITSGVSDFSAFVKHDAGIPLTFFMRVAPNAGPGAVGVIFAPVPSGVWTEINWGIFNGNPQTIFEGTSFATAFANVARVQIGVMTPAALAGVNQDVMFSVDQAAITPEPATLGLLAAGVLLTGVRKRRSV